MSTPEPNTITYSKSPEERFSAHQLKLSKYLDKSKQIIFKKYQDDKYRFDLSKSLDLRQKKAEKQAMK